MNAVDLPELVCIWKMFARHHMRRLVRTKKHLIHLVTMIQWIHPFVSAMNSSVVKIVEISRSNFATNSGLPRIDWSLVRTDSTSGMPFPWSFVLPVTRHSKLLFKKAKCFLKDGERITNLTFLIDTASFESSSSNYSLIFEGSKLTAELKCQVTLAIIVCIKIKDRALCLHWDYVFSLPFFLLPYKAS